MVGFCLGSLLIHSTKGPTKQETQCRRQPQGTACWVVWWNSPPRVTVATHLLCVAEEMNRPSARQGSVHVCVCACMCAHLGRP